jgi:hypothetical protein
MFPEAPEQQNQKERDRSMDPEILILSRIARTLDALEVRARARVVSYLAARYTIVQDEQEPF